MGVLVSSDGGDKEMDNRIIDSNVSNSTTGR